MFVGSCPAPCRDSCPHPRRGSAALNNCSAGAIDPYGGLDGRHRYFPSAVRHPIRSLSAHQRTASRLPFDPDCRMESAARHSSGTVPSSAAKFPNDDKEIPPSHFERGRRPPRQALEPLLHSQKDFPAAHPPHLGSAV